jgi:transcriptional regulator with XRE-family HTH domain
VGSGQAGTTAKEVPLFMPATESSARLNRQALRRLREDQRLPREQVALDLGCSAITVIRWELGYTTPSLDSLLAIADYYGVSLSDLVA